MALFPSASAVEEEREAKNASPEDQRQLQDLDNACDFLLIQVVAADDCMDVDERLSRYLPASAIHPWKVFKIDRCAGMREDGFKKCCNELLASPPVVAELFGKR